MSEKGLETKVTGMCQHGNFSGTCEKCRQLPPKAESTHSDAEAGFSFEVLKDPEEREKLAQEVLELVEKVREENFNHVIFLDKSARPIATIFSDLWRWKYPNNDRPDINFVNVGREITRKLPAEFRENESGEPDLSESLRSMILDVVGREKIHKLKETLPFLQGDGKQQERALIVDEYSATKRSLLAAKTILEDVSDGHISVETHSLPGEYVHLHEKTPLERYNDSIYNGGFAPAWSGEGGLIGVVDPEDETLLAKSAAKEAKGILFIVFRFTQATWS